MYTDLEAAQDVLQRYTADLATCTPLSDDEEKALAQKIKRGDLDARNDLVLANLRFVMRIAKGYQNLGLPLADLIGAGNMGLIRAAERFDANKGFRFITYAVWWIRQSIQCALSQQARTIRLPASRVALLHKVVQYNQNHAQTASEIAEALNLPESEVTELLREALPVMSLDTPFQTDTTQALKDKLADPEQTTPDVTFLQNMMQDEITGALDDLDTREREIVCLYFGLAGLPQMTLVEIGRRFQLSRERIRQIKAHALRKLKHLPQMQRLVGDVYNN